MKTSSDGARSLQRRTRPVFVVGCHRSGTNLLYDTLLSAGGFAVYRGYLPLYKMLIPRFGSMAKLKNRQRLTDAWICSKGFRRSGLNPSQLTARLLAECRSGGDFIRIVMNQISHQQNVARWAVYDPDNLLHIPSIKADLPEALFVHIIRDGRDVALSLSKMGGFRPFPWHRTAGGVLPAALYWEWMVRTGRQQGLRIADDYLEVRYEELVCEPRAALKKLGEFLDHDMDFDRIQKASLGRLGDSNSSFSDEQNRSNPVNRWRSMPSDEVAAIEGLVGECLSELGYPLASPAGAGKSDLRKKIKHASYFALLNAKLYLKTKTPGGRLTSLEALERSESVEPTGAE